MKRVYGLKVVCSLASVLLALVGVASSAAEQEFVVPLSDPGRPARLEVALNQGSLTIEGYDGQQVIVRAGSEAVEAEIEKVDGMYRIPNTATGLTIEEEDNAVSISTDWSGSGLDLVIQVPRATSLDAQIINGEALVVRGVRGDHELKNVNGGIDGRGLSGSVVATASNGPVTIELIEIDPAKPMSFITWNGDVDVTFPPTLAATLRLQAGGGEILSDFPVELQPTSASTETSEGKGYRVSVNREVVGTVGGGGPDMRFKTFNGDILVRSGG